MAAAALGGVGLALAVKEAEALNHNYVGTEHILLGLLLEGDGALLIDTGAAAGKAGFP